MIIDAILDRKEGSEYNPREFYFYCLGFPWNKEYIHVTEVMDYGTEEDVKRVLREYIDNNEYNPDIKRYIDSVDWL